MEHFYKILGILFAMSALGSAGAAYFARARSNQLMGLAFCALFLVGAVAVACLVLP